MLRTAKLQGGDPWVVSCAAIMFAMFTLQMGSLGFAPLLPSIQADFGMTYSQVGLFTGMYGLLAIFLSVPAGITAKRFGEKRVLFGGMLVVFLGLLLLSNASSLSLAYWGRGVWITGYRFAFVSVVTAIALTAPPEYRSRAMGFLGAFSATASIFGAPFGSKISQRHGWRGGIFAFGLMTLVGALVVITIYRQKTFAERTRDDVQPPGALTRSAFTSPLVWGIAILVGFSGFGQFCANFFIPGAMKTVFHRDAMASSFVLSTGYFVGIFANLLFGTLMDRYDRWKVLSTMFLLMVPASIAMTFNKVSIFEAGGVFMLALGLSVTNQVYSVAGQLFDSKETGNVIGIVSLGAGLFGYLGPQSLGWLRDHTGNFNSGWFELAIVSFTASVLSLVLRWASARRHSAPLRAGAAH